MDNELADVWTHGVVSMTDDPSTPAFTFRTVFLGCLWALGLGLASGILSFRANPPTIPGAMVILLAYPMGVFLAAVLPKATIFGIELNPGKFTVKEHALISVIANSANGLPFGVDNVVGQKWDMYMGDSSITFWNSLPWVFSTQMIGFGIAGIVRPYLVKPVSMLWPTTFQLWRLVERKDDVATYKTHPGS